MSWTALVPLKAAGARKLRLAGRLDAGARDGLTDAMLRHVAGVLSACTPVRRIVLLSAAPPPGWAEAWLPDRGGGLNAELTRARAALDTARLVVIHADLPWLAADDVAALLDAAAGAGAAIAPDRHRTGTNALAVADGTAPDFGFGADSFARHRALLPQAAVVTREGLGCDLDEPADLDAAADVLARLRAA